MDNKARIVLRTKKLGVLIRDARIADRRSVEECANAIGVSRGVFRAYEQGRQAPSLQELETLVYFLDLPIDHFWGKEAISDDVPPTEPIDLPQLTNLRQRMIGALLRQERMKASISMKALAEQTGISLSRLKSYELGERPIPLPELEIMLNILGGRNDNFFDHSGPIGEWMGSQRAIRDFLELPADIQGFVCLPVNRPYLELAMRLSSMSVEKLRSVAEGLLEITL
jgi:transcriptional regulator with XRE-family HTH domain